MNRTAVSILGAAVLLPAALGLAPPAGAVQAYKMPSVTGMTLQEAEDAVAALSSTTQFTVHTHNIDGFTQKQLSWPHWKVCGQTPAAGSPITADSDIEMDVARFYDSCGD
ncbi:PASTA domain-containing protein [Mycolicibacterium sp.]|uniref:PASTA domain-containing protein n=1 Tax=Mycolicibacterium sp. TaxID=2320850 RepID=UPI003D137F07